ncbi:MAG: aminotransferase class I/II-fold pyridoxal phosphate-dependent enzyme [Bacteroidota bacterium]
MSQTNNELKSKHEQMLEIMDEVAMSGRKLGILLQTIEDNQLDGKYIKVEGKRMINFGSCSYLGLELDQRLIAGTIDAVTRYGTVFSSSRAYLSSPLYDELENQLAVIFENPVVVTNNTTTGHLANIPILVGDNDAVIMDVNVHSSVQQAVSLLKERNIHIEVVRHSRLDLLEDRIKELKMTHDKIWYMSDGVYSMFGDLAPVKELESLLNTYEQLHLYIDDAHGMSWAGENGSGYVCSQVMKHDRMYLTTSLGKAFGATGGVLVFPNQLSYQRVRDFGRTLIFSIQIPPAVLGSAIASAKIHLSPEIKVRQNHLQDRIRFFNQAAKMYELPLIKEAASPVMFIGMGKPQIGYNMVRRLMNAGFYVNLSVFPSVAYSNTGLRIPITLNHSNEDIENLLKTIALNLPSAMKESGQTMKDLQRYFKLSGH